jgi:small ligand-binding sensory domain FIST
MTTCYAAAHSNDPTTFIALDQVLATIKHNLAGPANLAVLFCTRNHSAALERIAPIICEQLGTENLIGLGHLGRAIIAWHCRASLP